MSGEIYVQDFAALETLFKRFYKPLRAYAFRFVNDKDLSEDIVQDADYEQSFAAPDPETSMELSAEDEKAFDRPQESKKAEKVLTAKKSKAEEEAKEEKTSATEKKTVAKEEKVFAVSEKETEAAVREEKAVRKESRKSDRRPAKKKSIFDKLPRSKKRRELEEREARYRNRAAERMRQIKEQEEREAAHERASHTESEAMCACKRVHVTLGKSWHGRGLFLFLLSRNVPGLRC